MIVVTLAAEMGRGPAEVSKLAALFGFRGHHRQRCGGSNLSQAIGVGTDPGGWIWDGGGVAGGRLGDAWQRGDGCFAGVYGDCGWFFMVPLYALLQDRAAPEERGRIMAAINLLDCIATILVGGVVIVLKNVGLSGGQQLMFFCDCDGHGDALHDASAAAS